MTVTITLTLDEYSWVREAVDQMSDDIPHFYASDDAERMNAIGRAIAKKLKQVEQMQVSKH